MFALGIGVGAWGWSKPWQQEKEPCPSFSPQILQGETQAAVQTPPATQPPAQEGLPWQLQYTNLVVRELASYDGPYLEDGSLEELTGVCGMVLENKGNIGIEYVQVVVTQGARELTFNATYIPPRGSVLVLEKSRQEYSRETVSSCQCRTLIPGDYDWEKEQILITPDEGFGLQVTNLTEKTLPYVRIFYKRHDAQADMHVGGITYCVVLPDLQPGESRTVLPYQYANGYSSVVAVVIDT